MRSSMISKVASSLIATVFAVASSAPAAQAQDTGFDAKVKVPFAFQTVTGQHFAPGTYTIRMNGQQGILIRSDTASGVATTHLANDGLPATQGKAIFTHYGDRYFLHSVSVAGNASHLIFDTSKSERESQIVAGKASAGVEVALLVEKH